MQNRKKHIALFLLVGFLFPQVANSMHYFVVDHKFSFLDSSKKINPDFEYHSCTYHLNGVSGIVPTENFKEDDPTLYFSKKHKFCRLVNYVHNPHFNFSLRGPPGNVFSERN